MKKLFITTLVLGLSFAGISQKVENKAKNSGTEEVAPDSTMKTKANYNTTRSNKKSIAQPDKKKVKTTTVKSSGGNAIKPNLKTILERRKMK